MTSAGPALWITHLHHQQYQKYHTLGLDAVRNAAWRPALEADLPRGDMLPTETDRLLCSEVEHRNCDVHTVSLY
jgi:hypothetical protein